MTMPSKTKWLWGSIQPMTLFGPFFTVFLQGEAGEAGNPGPHGEPGVAVSAVSCWSTKSSRISFYINEVPRPTYMIYRLLVLCCVWCLCLVLQMKMKSRPWSRWWRWSRLSVAPVWVMHLSPEPFVLCWCFGLRQPISLRWQTLGCKRSVPKVVRWQRPETC